MSDTVLAHLAATRSAIVERLLELVRIPSVSTDPAYHDGMAAAQRVLTARLRDAGLCNVQSIDAGGHPALYGEWLGIEDRPTFLVYGHYDVQPPDPVEQWQSPPFEPEIRDDRLYGRGVSDDKGPLSIALETIAAFLRIDGALPVNVKVLLEGEEEIGSATLGGLLRKHRDLLLSGAVISADGARWRADLPTVNVGSRGVAGFEFTVETAAKDLHSGRYGGAVPNALHVLAALLGELHAADGTVAVPGFYDGAREPSAAERRALAAIPFDEASFFAGIGAAPRGEPGYTALERLWFRPCLDVNGAWGGYTGPGGKTVIPHEARAKLTVRLVPGQEPGRICQAVKDFLSRRCPDGARIGFGADKGRSAAYELPLDHPVLSAAEAALTEVHGTRPHRIRIGGTLPVSDLVYREYGIHTVMFSFSTADEDFHAPNEFLRLSSLDEGLRAWTALFRHLGEIGVRDLGEFRRAALRKAGAGWSS